MKILQIIGNLSSGGAEKFVKDLSIEFNKMENIEIDVLLLSDEKSVHIDDLLLENINVYVIPLKKMSNPLNIIHIKNHIKVGNYDVVHSHLFPSLYWTSLAKRLLSNKKTKYIYTEHSTMNKRRTKPVLKQLEKFVYYNFHSIVSISKGTNEKLIAWLNPSPRKSEKFNVIQNGINLIKYQNACPYKKEFLVKNINSRDKIIVMIGRFVDAKDHETVIKSMSYISSNTHLLFIGEGPRLDYTINYVKEMNLENRIHFLGYRKDVEKIIKTCDILIQSSNWEGFGLAALEGMSSGKPVIASNIKGLKEVVDGAGILFEKGNFLMLAEKVNSLLDLPELYEETSIACLERSQNYNIVTSAIGYLNIYQEHLK